MSNESVLMVSTYPPRRCGVGSYAKQAVVSLRRNGIDVDVLSPPDCAGTYRTSLRGFLNPLRILRWAYRYDRVVIQYSHPEFYYGVRPHKWLNFLTTLSFMTLFSLLRGKLEVVVHEPPDFPSSLHRNTLARVAWIMARRVSFHSATERLLLAEHLGVRPPESWKVAEHGEHFSVYCELEREEARRHLGLPLEEELFLCIGFLQRSKGFDRVARAFSSKDRPGAKLFIVGSIRRDDDLESRQYRDTLSRMASESRSIHLVEAYLSDAEFDMWLRAADYVVLPYRSISSSGVLARASMLGRRCIVADVGGLRDQSGPLDRVFGSDEELEQLLDELVEAGRTEIS